MSEDEILSAQIRAGRALLGWSQVDLAERTGLSKTVIASLEQGNTDARMSTLALIRKAFDEAGVTFITDRDGSYGVRRRGRGEPQNP